MWLRTQLGKLRRRLRRIDATIPLPYDPAGAFLDFATRPNIDESAERIRLDDEGMPLVRHGDIWAHNPVTIAQKGLQEFSRGDLARAEREARWLCKAQDAATGAWFYGFDFPVGAMGVTLRAPWASAMAQGQVMSLLSRVYGTTRDEVFLDTARAGLPILQRDVASGGLRADFFGHPFLEEYPTTPPSFALNGFMFALLGLYDLGFHDDEARTIFEEGMATLVYALPFYDGSRTSSYHLGHITNPYRKVHASPGYHTIHIKQLLALNSVWPLEALAFYARRWANL